jgi:hypothetical protein
MVRRKGAEEGVMPRKFEVRFRGMNKREAGQPNMEHHGELRGWRPTTGKKFEVREDVARRRYAELVKDGVAGREVDGIVPHVVEIALVTDKRKTGQERPFYESMLWQYAEPDAEQWGPWAVAS